MKSVGSNLAYLNQYVCACTMCVSGCYYAHVGPHHSVGNVKKKLRKKDKYKLSEICPPEQKWSPDLATGMRQCWTHFVRHWTLCFCGYFLDFCVCFFTGLLNMLQHWISAVVSCVKNLLLQ